MTTPTDTNNENPFAEMLKGGGNDKSNDGGLTLDDGSFDLIKEVDIDDDEVDDILDSIDDDLDLGFDDEDNEDVDISSLARE